MLVNHQRTPAYRLSSQSTILSCFKLTLYASSMLSNIASRSSKARRSAVRDDKLSGSDVGMHKPVKVRRKEHRTHTVHLYTYLYVVFGWMRGAVSLLAAQLERRTKKEGAVRMQGTSISPWSFLMSLGHVWYREGNRIQR